MIETNARPRPRALLVSVRTPNVEDDEADASLRELERLVTTLGFDVVGFESQRRPSQAGPTLLGAGKVEELAEGTRDELTRRADVVVFDNELGPSQLRNLEKALAVEVMDRTGVIIEIFSRHARTRAARLQVEIARLKYLTPRLREAGNGPTERQAGRGAGESQLELDRRRVRDRMTELREELEGVQREQENRRDQRADTPGVALVGYTNAGKSSLMRALTGSEVYVENKLFATLDTTVRALHPETRPRILVSDTVGFINKLPHDLVASFKSTLDEALHASLLLFVADASDPSFREQLEVSFATLREVGTQDIPHLVVLNKTDQLNEAQVRRLKFEFPSASLISTRSASDVAQLRELIVNFFERDFTDTEIFIPFAQGSLTGELRNTMRVLEEKFEEEGTRYRVRARPIDLERFRRRAAALSAGES